MTDYILMEIEQKLGELISTLERLTEVNESLLHKMEDYERYNQCESMTKE